MFILAYIVIGLIGGAIAKAIFPGKQGGGWLITILLGIVGAVLAGFLGRLLFDGDKADIWSIGGLISSVVGALIILFVYGLVTKNKA